MSTCIACLASSLFFFFLFFRPSHPPHPFFVRFGLQSDKYGYWAFYALVEPFVSSEGTFLAFLGLLTEGMPRRSCLFWFDLMVNSVFVLFILSPLSH